MLEEVIFRMQFSPTGHRNILGIMEGELGLRDRTAIFFLIELIFPTIHDKFS